MNAPLLIPADVRSQMLAAAREAGAGRILARASWLRRTCDLALLGPDFVLVPGRGAIRLGCPDCIDVIAVEDWQIPADWIAAP